MNTNADIWSACVTNLTYSTNLFATHKCTDYSHYSHCSDLAGNHSSPGMHNVRPVGYMQFMAARNAIRLVIHVCRAAGFYEHESCNQDVYMQNWN